jgi:nucleoside-diphosphate-sugar epimerase
VKRVAVIGVGGPLGQRLPPALEAAGVEHVVGIDLRASPVRARGRELVAAEAVSADLDSALKGVDAVIHLAGADDARSDPARLTRLNVDATRRVLAAASRVTTLVCLSSATVYGAWPDNPVPLTEDAPLRPNPGAVDAVDHAEVERLVADWAADHGSASVAVMRPVPVLGPGVDGWLSRVLGGGVPFRGGQNDPPRQFLHVDDLVAALVVAASAGLDGTFNVTPDGWIAGDVMRDLVATRPRLPLPAHLAPMSAAWAWRLHLSEVPPSLWPLLEQPWVVANDRLRAAGWAPRYTSEEALVGGRPGSPWREMSPQRRQKVALAAAGLGVAGLAGCVFAVVVRVRRRRGASRREN